MKPFLIVLFVSLLVVSCSQQQSAPPSQQSVSQTPTKEKSKDGAGMIAQVRLDLDSAKQQLMVEGKYNCCIKGGCNECALDEGQCGCANDLKEGKAVCKDCYDGWQDGKGAVEGVKKEKVKMEMMDMDHDGK